MTASRKASPPRSITRHVAISAPAGNQPCSAQIQLGELKCEPEVDPKTPETGVIDGQLLTLDDQHKIAIHSRAGELWVAEFHGDHAELVRAAAWFSLHYGIGHMSFSLRRALRFAVPLSNEMEVAIERLHQRRLERAPCSSCFRHIGAVRIARHPASIVARLIRRGRLIRDWLVVSKSRLVKPSDL